MGSTTVPGRFDPRRYRPTHPLSGCSVPSMAVRPRFTETLSWVLDAAENASPLQAVEAVTDAFAEALGRRQRSS